MVKEFEFAQGTSVNRFDVGEKYNNCMERKDYLGFFSWLMSVAPQAMRELVKNMVKNIKEGLVRVKLGLFKGKLPGNEKNLADPSVNEYPNANPEEYRALEGQIFTGLEMDDKRYFDPEYIARARAIDSLWDDYLESYGGQILNAAGEDVTEEEALKAHRSVALGKDEYELTFSFGNIKYDMRLLEPKHVQDMETVLGIEDIASKAAYRIGGYMFFSMDNPEIKQMFIDYELHRKTQAKDKGHEEEKLAESHEEPKTADAAETKAATQEAPESGDKPAETNEQEAMLDGDTLVLNAKHFDAVPGGVGYKPFGRLNLVEPLPFTKLKGKEAKEARDKAAMAELPAFAAKFMQEMNALGKDPSEIFVKLSIFKEGIDETKDGCCVVQIPYSDAGHPGGDKLRFILPDGDLGKNKRVTINSKGGRDFFVSLGETFTICDRYGNPKLSNDGPITIKGSDLIKHFSVLGYKVSPEKDEGMPEAYIAAKAGDKTAKKVVFDPKTTKISTGTIKDMPELEEIDFNHAKATVVAGAFKNLSSRVKFLNAENVTFNDNALTNCAPPVFVMPEVISSDKAAVLSDLTSKAAALNAEVQEDIEVVTPEAVKEANDRAEEIEKDSTVEENATGPEQEQKPEPEQEPEQEPDPELNSVQKMAAYEAMFGQEQGNFR